MEKQHFAIYKENGELKWKGFDTEQAALDQLNDFEGKTATDPLLFYNPDKDFFTSYSGIAQSEARDIVARFNKAHKE